MQGNTILTSNDCSGADPLATLDKPESGGDRIKEASFWSIHDLDPLLVLANSNTHVLRKY